MLNHDRIVIPNYKLPKINGNLEKTSQVRLTFQKYYIIYLF